MKDMKDVKEIFALRWPGTPPPAAEERIKLRNERAARLPGILVSGFHSLLVSPA